MSGFGYLLAWKALGVPPWVEEFRFHPERKWRFDFAWPAKHVAVEIDGGVWSRGRHVRPKGFLLDREKINSATELGWRVLNYTPQQAGTSVAVRQILAVLSYGAG